MLFFSVDTTPARAEVQDRALIGRALTAKFVRLRALFVNLSEERRELSEAKIFSVALFPTE